MQSPLNLSEGQSPEITISGDSGALVLVVDDERPILSLSEMMLTEQGFRVITAIDPLQGLEIYRSMSTEIDMVLLDYAMPGMNGAELFKQMQMINPDVKALLISGYAERESISAMLDEGLKGYIPKPYSPDALVAKVRGVLGKAAD